MASMFKIVMNENASALKDTPQNLTHGKARRINSQILENYKLSQNVRSKLFSLSVTRVLNSINKSKTYDRESNLSPML